MEIDLDKIINRDLKQKLAEKIAEKVENGQVIGFGSGTTAYLAAIEIGKKVKEQGLKIKAVPTSEAIENVCKEYGIEIGSLIEDNLDWAFDGADEVDTHRNMIKGMGKAMFKEKLNIVSSPITYILVDDSKFVDYLGEKHPVPIEVFPSAVKYVSEELRSLGATEITYRGMTENYNSILDTKFREITPNLEEQIKSITGVIESGLFFNYKVEILRN